MSKPPFSRSITSEATEPTEDAPETTQTEPESVLHLADANPKSRTRPRQFYVASQWDILAGTRPGTITATNNTTGDRYEGTSSDFNCMLRGD